MPPQHSFAYNSFIKNIYLELHTQPYEFNHQSLTGDDLLSEVNDSFLGRKKILNSFVDILHNGSGRGAYLVTGYRGMGKTSFVNQALIKLRRLKKQEDDAKRKKKDNNVITGLWEIKLSLAQSELKDVDILKHIVNQLLEKVEGTDDYREARRFSLNNVFSWAWPLVTLFVIFCSFGLLLPAKATDESKTIIENLLGIVSFSGLATLLLYKFISWTYGKYINSNAKGQQWLTLSFFLFSGSIVFVLAFSVFLLYTFPNSTYEIIFFLVLGLATLTILYGLRTQDIHELHVQGRVPVKTIHEKIKLLHNRCNAQITSEDQFRESFSSSISSLFKKDVMLYPIANPREIESELIKIISDLKNHYQCIFVFDELDKVDTNFDTVSNGSPDTANERRTYLNDLRERRHLITHILGSLKYFINEAEARFIFIAGREMFEAALADISDRQSSISSIFHRVIYVDSFLKDQSVPETITSSIGVLVEKILERLLLPDNINPVTNEIVTSEKHDFLTGYYIHLLSGPQKLPEIAARKTIFVLQNFLGYLVYRSNGSPKKVVKLLEEYIIREPRDSKERIGPQNIFFHKPEKTQVNNFTHYLYFSYLDQYKLGFTAYLFQPFLTMYSSFMKRYSDNTLVSTPYLIDNLIKFHPFAFSAQNLELIPEILSTNKSPISRPFLEELITFLGQNHIRRTESGLFEYKFYDRTHNEITYISKMFEDEAAAFNFTLDENFSVKANLISKIRQLRETHRSSSDKSLGSENPIASIIFLNRILGDVRFQDEEYEDAIVSYQDAIQMLDYERLSYANHYITFVRIKLKLGLAYEKIKAHEFALGHYAGVIEEGGQYLGKHARKHDVIYRELLMLVMQAYSATLYVQEKLPEGITFQKIKNSVRSFHALLGKFQHGYYNRDILLATFYSNIGTALYYKNMVLPQKVNEARIEALPRPGRTSDEQLVAQDVAEKAVLSCFPTPLDPVFITTSVQEIPAIAEPWRIHSDARISFNTYVYCKLTLKTLLGCDSNALVDLLNACPALIRVETEDETPSYRSLQHIRRLTSIGHALAKLGDFLLPLAEIRKVVVPDVLGCFHSNNTPAPEHDEQKARLLLLHTYFAGQNVPGNPVHDDLKGTKIHPRLIVHIYYLASLFYIEAAETANAAFQLRKILFTLRSLYLIVGDQAPETPKPGQNGLLVNGYLKSLEFNLVKRILEMSSWMSHSSDRPQLSKTKKYFGVNTLRTPHSISNELYGNLSNNPDTKETVLAYALLKTQYQPYSYDPNKKLLDCYKTSLEHKLVSAYGSIAHHIIRIMELELHTNMNHKILVTHCWEGIWGIVDRVYETLKPKLIFTTNTKKEVSLREDKQQRTNHEEYAKQLISRITPFTLTGKINSWESKYFHACKLYDVETSDYLKPPTKPEAKEFDVILKRFDTYFMTGDEPLKTQRIKQLETWVFEYSELILNSVFNLAQIDRIINTYGINYILSYSYMAKIHEHLGTWLKHLHLCRILNSRYKLGITIDQTLNELVGPQLSTSFDPLTSYQVALQYYYQAIQLHKEGNAYRHQISNLVYLEDDYNDNLYHFGAALERLLINSGSIRKRIDFLKTEISTASMYKYSTYIGEEPSPIHHYSPLTGLPADPAPAE